MFHIQWDKLYNIPLLEQGSIAPLRPFFRNYKVSSNLSLRIFRVHIRDQSVLLHVHAISHLLHT